MLASSPVTSGLEFHRYAEGSGALVVEMKPLGKMLAHLDLVLVFELVTAPESVPLP